MDRNREPDLAEAVAGALDWWREAGIDCDFSDEPVQWLESVDQETGAPEAVTEASPTPSRSPETNAEPSRPADFGKIPDSLSEFSDWWMNHPELAEGAISARVAPRGPANPEIMVIVPEPEAEDAGVLLSGPQGRLLDAMLAAMGIEAQSAYRASVLPRNMPGADWDELAQHGLGKVLARHVSLVAPKRLILFGANILPLTGNDLPQGPADLRKFNHEGATTGLLACRSLAAMIEQPRWKAKVWQAWLEWTA